MTPQQKSVLKYMKTRQSINPLRAQINLGIERLAPRILELKNMGYKIDDKMIKVVNRDGKLCHVKKYWLV